MDWQSKQLIILILILTGISSMILIPIMIKLAWRFDILDKPDSLRKLHQETTPYLGGGALWAATCTGILCIKYWFPHIDLFLGEIIFLSFPFIIGLIDDKIGLSATFRLTIQIIAVLGLLYFNQFIPFDLNLSHWVITFVLIFLGMTFINAFNLIDGLDGLSLGLGAITITVFSILPAWGSTICVLGSSAAFLGSNVLISKWNLHPAKIFLGDSGSLFIGVFIFWIFIKQVSNFSHFNYYQVLCILFCIPCIDIFMVIFQRLKARTGILKPDRKHLHHHFRSLGVSHKRSVSIIHLLAGLQLIIFWMAWYSQLWLLGFSLIFTSNICLYGSLYIKIKFTTNPLLKSSQPRSISC